MSTPPHFPDDEPSLHSTHFQTSTFNEASGGVEQHGPVRPIAGILNNAISAQAHHSVFNDFSGNPQHVEQYIINVMNSSSNVVPNLYQQLQSVDASYESLSGNVVQTIAEQCANSFTPVYKQGAPGHGIGGYDLRSSRDRVFAFDYDHSGNLDHLVLYRPGTGSISILKKYGSRAFTPVYLSGDPDPGIGGYNLLSAADRAFAFDYNHSGKLDHLVLYRPGTGVIWILQNNRGAFSAVYRSDNYSGGIGGYDLLSPRDRVFAFDYDHSGKLDYLVLYRPGMGTIWILGNNKWTRIFYPVYNQGSPGMGIGDYDLASTADHVFAFDGAKTGKSDCLSLVRPGTGTIWILENNNGVFTPIYRQGDPGHGIGGYDLRSSADRVFAFDYDKDGKSDHLSIYRPGTGTFWILRHDEGKLFVPVYRQSDPGAGVGGYDIKSSADRAFSFDYDSSGKLDHLVFYRPGSGAIFILKNNNHE